MNVEREVEIAFDAKMDDSCFGQPAEVRDPMADIIRQLLSLCHRVN